MRCDNCDLSNFMCDTLQREQLHERTYKIINDSNDDRAILFIIDAPPFNSTIESMLYKLSKKLSEFERVNTYVTFSIGCNYPANAKIKSSQVKACSPNLSNKITELKIEHKNLCIIPCGARSIESLKFIEVKDKSNFSNTSWIDMLPRRVFLRYIYEKEDKRILSRIRVIASPDYWSTEKLPQNETTLMSVYREAIKVVSNTEKPVEVSSNVKSIILQDENIEKFANRLSSYADSISPRKIDIAFDIETNSLYGYAEGSKLLTYALCFKVEEDNNFFDAGYVRVAVTVDHKSNDYLSSESAIELMNVLLADSERYRLITHNGSFDITFVMQCNEVKVIDSWTYDTMVLASLMGSPKGTRGLKYQAYTYLGAKDYTAELTEDEDGHKDMENTPIDILLEYNMNDSLYTLKLFENQKVRLAQMRSRGIDCNKMFKFYKNFLSPAQRMLARMSTNGLQYSEETRRKYEQIYINEANKHRKVLESCKEVIEFEETFLNEDFVQYRDDYDAWLEVVRPGKKKPNKYRKKAPEYEKLNWSSPKQVAKFAIEHLMLPIIETTNSGGASMSNNVLEEYSKLNSVFRELSRFRKITKELSTYIVPLSKFARNGLVHAKFNLGFTDSGRLSSDSPNLQNVKSRNHSIEEYKVKNIFETDKYHIMWAFDFSQAELRVLASIARDMTMINMFLNGQDPHTATGAKLFNVSLDKVSEHMRFVGKTTNFGIVYQMGVVSLASKFFESILEKTIKNLGDEKKSDLELREMVVSEGVGILKGLQKTIKPFNLYEYQSETVPKEYIVLAQYVLKSHMMEFKGIWEWIAETKSMIMKNCYSVSPLGRVFFLPNVKSTERRLVQEAIRTGVNAPIQGTASDMTVNGMVRVEKYIFDNGLQDYITIRNNVHDAVYGTCPRSREMVEHLMNIKAILEDTSMYEFMKVPFLTDFEIGPSWGKLEKLKDLSTLGDVLVDEFKE